MARAPATDPFAQQGPTGQQLGPDGAASGQAATPIGVDGPRAGSDRFANSHAPGQPPANANPQQSAIDEALARLESVGPLDRETKDRLAEDLAATNPEQWPLLLSSIEASLRFRQQRAAQDTAEDRAAPTGAEPPVEALARNVMDQGEPPSRARPQQADANERPWDSLEPPPVDQREADAILRDLAMRLAEKQLPAAAAVAAGARAQRASYELSETPPDLAGEPSQYNAPAESAADAAPGMFHPDATAKSLAGANSSAATGAVEQVSLEQVEQLSPGESFERSLAAAIEALEETTDGGGEETIRDQQALRLMYLAAGRREDAMRPIVGLGPAEQDYWTRQFWSLATVLDPRRDDDPTRRAADAKQQLEAAVAKLGELSSLVVRNMAFCTEVGSYGVYKPFEDYEFTPGQQVLLYAEVENFKTIDTRDGYHTALRSSYRVLDAQGRNAASEDFALMEEDCQNPRRDYFVRYLLYLPENLYPGPHTLQLTIEDTLSRKVGQSTIEFTIKQP